MTKMGSPVKSRSGSHLRSNLRSQDRSRPIVSRPVVAVKAKPVVETVVVRKPKAVPVIKPKKPVKVKKPAKVKKVVKKVTKKSKSRRK